MKYGKKNISQMEKNKLIKKIINNLIFGFFGDLRITENKFNKQFFMLKFAIKIKKYI